MTNEDVLRDRLAAAVDETDRLRARVTRLERCLAFFTSAIKCGEPWSKTCEDEYRKAVSDAR